MSDTVQEIDTLEKLVEIVGKRMQHYHVFRRELAALREAAQQKHAPDVLNSGHCEHVPDGQYCPYCKEA